MDKTVFRFRVWLVVLIGLLVVGSFVGGAGVMNRLSEEPILGLVGRVAQIVPGIFEVEHGPRIKASTDLQPLATFWQVRERILQDYVDTIENPTELTYGAIRGMVAALGDPYSRFMTPDEYEEFQAEATGQFEGIGAILKEQTVGDTDVREVVIVSIFPHGPAAEVDIRPGDVVLAVNGESVEGMGVRPVADMIRGPDGTQVTLALRRQGREESFPVTITRRRVKLPPPEHEVREGDIGYMWLQYFNIQASADLGESIKELLDQDVKGLVLDLSDNGGGLLQQAIAVTSLFYDEGPVLYVKERDSELQPCAALAGRAVVPPDIPIVVLVNHASASASEIVAGALQDTGRGTIVGQNTFGKARVQTVIKLNDGSALALSTAGYLTPNKRDLSKEYEEGKRGVKPDLVFPDYDRDEAGEAQSLAEWFEQEHNKQVDLAIGVLERIIAGEPVG